MNYIALNLIAKHADTYRVTNIDPVQQAVDDLRQTGERLIDILNRQLPYGGVRDRFQHSIWYLETLRHDHPAVATGKAVLYRFYSPASPDELAEAMHRFLLTL